MRFLDLLFSIFGIILALPILLISIILIYLEDFKNPIFKQSRIGKNACFKIIKLRTLSTENNVEERRITAVGGVLRKLSIDEIPQLINVLKGEMSIVGVRPDICEKNNTYLKQLPGITGLAQISGRSNITDEKRKSLNDYWENNANLFLYLKIIFKTVLYFLSLRSIKDAI